MEASTGKQTKKYEMDMCEGALLPKILIYTFPLMLSGILQLLFNAADIIVVGRFVGHSALAAVGSTSSLINLLINVFMGLSVGTNVLVARFYGAGKQKDLGEVVHTAIMTALCGGLILLVLGILLSGPLLRLMDTPDDVISDAVLYMRIYFAGMPVVMLYNFGSAILRAIGDTKRPLYYLSLAGVINVVLNLFFVLVCNLSVAGVALATDISQCISAFLVLRCLVKSEGAYRVILSELRITGSKLLKMMEIGIPAGLQGALFSISNVLIQSSVNTFGSIAMAGNTAASNLEGFVYTSMNAVHQTAISFTGQNYGARNYKRIGKIMVLCLLFVTTVGLLLGNGVTFFGSTLLQLYAEDADVIAYGMIRLRIITTTYFLCGIMDVMVGLLRGMGYSVMPALVSLAGACGLRVVWIFTIFRKIHTLECLYLSYPVSWGLTFAIHFICFLVVYRKLLRKAG